MAEREDIGSPLLEQTLTSDDSTRSLINVRRYVQQTSTEQRKVWELNYREAAIYLQEGQNNEKFRTHPKNQNAVPAYLIVHNVWYNILDLAVSLLLLMLALCEHPAVKPFRLDEIVHGSLELFALTIIGLQLGMKMRWLGLKIFVTHKRTAIKSLTLIVMYAEAIVVLIRQTNHFRVTRALRPIFLIDTHYCGGVRRVMRQIFQSLPPILDMLVLLLFIMLLFAILAFYLFQADSINYQFDNFEESFVNLFVLLTTANFPDVMMPAYHKNRFYSLFFIIYLVLELYFLMNLLLAVVYETFTGIEKEKFRQLLLHKYKGASCAFKLLCSTKNPGKVTFLHFSGLMKYFKPRHKKRDVYLSFKALNVNETGLLTLGEFCNIYEITSLKWSHYKGNTHWFDSLPFVLNMIMRGIHKLVVSALFNYFIYIVIAANGIWFLVDTVTLSNQRAKFEFHEEFALTWYSIMFVSIYVVETILKILALGPKEYFNYGWNIFDFMVTLSAVLAVFGTFIDDSFHYIVVLRPLRLLRIFKIKKRYRNVMDTLYVLLPRMISVAIVLVLLYYFFAIVGMELFYGIPLKNCCKNSSVESFYKYDNSTIYNMYFYLNNFDNILVTYVTLFELTVVNNWHIIMQAVTIVTNHWSQIYFMLFYIASMVVMTIIVAFILEAFLFRMQYKMTVKQEVDRLEDRMIQVDVMMSKNDIENNFENFKSDWHLNLLHRKLTEVDSIYFRGTRGTTKQDLSHIMYKDEVTNWIKEEESKNKADLREFLQRRTMQQIVVQPEIEQDSSPSHII